jgi:hypothetical protein
LSGCSRHSRLLTTTPACAILTAGDKGDKDCAKNPGQLGHTKQDAKFLAKLGVDWWKEDSCYSDSGDHATAIAEYGKMRDALNATGRDVWFALCGWETWYATDTDQGGGQAIGNSWRVGPDTGTGWTSVMKNTEAGLLVAKAGVPGPRGSGGAWSDGSLLLNPGMGHGPENYIDHARHRSMFGLWCTLGFNLLLTGNLSALDPFVLQTWGNAELVAGKRLGADRRSRYFHLRLAPFFFCRARSEPGPCRTQPHPRRCRRRHRCLLSLWLQADAAAADAAAG